MGLSGIIKNDILSRNATYVFVESTSGGLVTVELKDDRGVLLLRARRASADDAYHSIRRQLGIKDTTLLVLTGTERDAADPPEAGTMIWNRTTNSIDVYFSGAWRSA